MTQLFAEVALLLPKRQCFDYCLPEGMSKLLPGIRVRVPYGHGEKLGIVVKTKDSSQWQSEKLKSIAEVLDTEPLFDNDILALLNWAAGYYCHPLGDVLFTALPAKLRKGKANQKVIERIWKTVATEAGSQEQVKTQIKRARKQLALYNLLVTILTFI